jgi:hypothetical protein
MRCFLALSTLGLMVALLGAETRLPETSSKVTYQCRHRGDHALKIDGKLDDDAWKLAQAMTDFGIVRTDKSARWKTVARLLWDDEYLYVGFECSIDGIRTKITERDGPVWEGEAAEMFICPKGADAIYYEINFNPKNVIYDSRIESWKYEEQVKHWQKWAKDFNADIKSAVQIQRDDDNKVTGWTVEAAVPFKDLDVAGREAPMAGDVWLFNVFRVAALADGTQELSHWQPVKPEFHRPHQFPRLEFVKR